MTTWIRNRTSRTSEDSVLASSINDMMHSLSDLFTDDEEPLFFSSSLGKEAGIERFTKSNKGLLQDPDQSFDFLNFSSSHEELPECVADFGKTMKGTLMKDTARKSLLEELNMQKQLNEKCPMPTVDRKSHLAMTQRFDLQNFEQTIVQATSNGTSTSRVSGAAPTTSVYGEPETVLNTPRRTFRRCVERNQDMLPDSTVLAGHRDNSEAECDSPMRRCVKHHADQSELLNNPSHIVVSPFSSVSDSSSTEVIVVAPSFPSRRPELLESSPLVCESQKDKRGRRSYRQSSSSPCDSIKDAAPKQPSRSRSPSLAPREDYTASLCSTRCTEQVINSRW